ELFQWLLDHGADINHQQQGGAGCVLDTAALNHSTGTVSFLLAKGADIRQSVGLHCAIMRTDDQGANMLNYLLDHGADINALEYQHVPDYFNTKREHGLGSPLQMAVRKGKSNLVRLLLESGANPLVMNTRGQIPARYLKEGDVETREFLQKYTS
ncbi:ankyrin, partial [Tothia fuscella]